MGMVDLRAVVGWGQPSGNLLLPQLCLTLGHKSAPEPALLNSRFLPVSRPLWSQPLPHTKPSQQREAAALPSPRWKTNSEVMEEFRGRKVEGTREGSLSQSGLTSVFN